MMPIFCLGKMRVRRLSENAREHEAVEQWGRDSSAPAAPSCRLGWVPWGSHFTASLGKFQEIGLLYQKMHRL